MLVRYVTFPSGMQILLNYIANLVSCVSRIFSVLLSNWTTSFFPRYLHMFLFCNRSCFFLLLLAPSNSSKRALLITSCLNSFSLPLLDPKPQLLSGGHRKFLPWPPIALIFHHFNFLLFPFILYLLSLFLSLSLYLSIISPSVHPSILHFLSGFIVLSSLVVLYTDLSLYSLTISSMPYLQSYNNYSLNIYW